MSPEAVTAERVYTALKADIVGGRHLPRAEIVIAAIARDQRVSISPVRVSAQRLIGERLLEPLPGGGFRIPDLTERGLRDLYAWHGQLIQFALQGHSRDDLTGPVLADGDIAEGSADALAQLARRIFQSIASHAGNDELCYAVAAAADRLHAVRVKEFRHVPLLREELHDLGLLMGRGDAAALVRAVRAYDRRRLKRVDLLVEAAGGTLAVDDRTGL